jgi:hypothetical protein
MSFWMRASSSPIVQDSLAACGEIAPGACVDRNTMQRGVMK